MKSNTFKKIEHYLYNYKQLDFRVNFLNSKLEDYEYNQTYNRWIKSKSSSIEYQAISNIDTEQRVIKINNWKKLIKDILKEFKENNKLFYEFTNLKYFKKHDSNIIQEKLNLSIKEQKDIRARILQYIFSSAIKRNMLHEE